MHFSRRILLLSVAACALTESAHALTPGQRAAVLSAPPAYFVSSVSGNDTNTGTSAGTAVKTIARLAAIDAASPRNIWNLAAGSKWREQLTFPRSNMTVQAYGSGTMPILDGSDQIVSGWSKTAGETYTYQVTVPLDNFNGTYGNALRAWENDTGLLYETSIALVDSTPGSYYPSDVNSSPITLYVHASDGTNPSANGKTYEYSRRPYAVLSTGPVWGGSIPALTNDTVKGLWARRGTDVNGSLEMDVKPIISNTLVTDGNKHNVLIGPGAIVNGLTLSGGQDAGQGTNPFVYFGSFSGENAVFNNLTITQTACVATAIYSHGSGTPGSITFNNLNVTGGNQGIETGYPFTVNGGTLDMTACTNGTPINVDPSGFATVSNASLLTNAPGNAVSLAAGASATISGSTLSSPGAGNILRSQAANAMFNVSGSTFIGGGGNSAILMSGTTNSLISNHNDFSGATNYPYQINADTTLTSDYNTFLPLQQMSINSVASYLWTYQNITGQDAHSSPAPVTVSAPFAHYNMVQGSPNTTIFDISGRSTNVAISTTPSWTTGGLAFSSTGASVTGTNFAPIGGVISVSTVFNASTLSGSQRFVSKESGYAEDFGLGLSGTHLYASVRDSTNAAITITGLATLTTGSWHEAHLVYDGANISLYLDGVLDNQTPVSHPMTSAGYPRVFYVGATGSDIGPAYFAGTLADAKVWTIALSGTNVATDYAATKATISATHPAVSLP